MTHTPVTDELRPTSWNDYRGQTKMRAHLLDDIESAILRDAPLEHVFLAAPPGAGKTSLAELIADQLQVPVLKLVCPLSSNMLRKVVTGFEGILILDEVHSLTKAQQTEILPLLEFGYLQGKTGRIEAGALTIIACTTERQLVAKAVQDRFPIQPRYEPYTDDQMAEIAAGMAKKAGLELSAEYLKIVASASAGSPRVMRSLIVRTKNKFVVYGEVPAIESVLEACGVGADGLSEGHRDYLKALDQLGGEAGIAVLSSLLQENVATLVERERLLIQRGMIEMSSSGRALTNHGVKAIRALRVVA